MFRKSGFSPTYIIIALNLLVYAYTSVIGGDFITTGDYPIAIFGQVNEFVLEQGLYWQLFTSMFVHANIVHLAGNMFFFLIFGLRAEDLFSTREYLLVYLSSGLAGGLLTLLLGPMVVSVGASGAIFGVFGACIIYIRRTIGQSIISALFYAFFLLIISSGPRVNNVAHLGGLILGLVLGYALASKHSNRATYGFSYSY